MQVLRALGVFCEARHVCFASFIRTTHVFRSSIFLFHIRSGSIQESSSLVLLLKPYSQTDMEGRGERKGKTNLKVHNIINMLDGN